MGGLIFNGNLTEDIELRHMRYIKLKTDSTLTISMTFEICPRLRISADDIEISCQNHTISWLALAHEGQLSENLDAMYLSKNWKGEQSQWM